MNLTDEEAVQIYAAARSALHEAARQQAEHLHSSQLALITVNILAAAGRAAFEASMKAVEDHRGLRHG